MATITKRELVNMVCAQLDNGLSNEESRPGDFNQPVNPGEDLFG